MGINDVYFHLSFKGANIPPYSEGMISMSWWAHVEEAILKQLTDLTYPLTFAFYLTGYHLTRLASRGFIEFNFDHK